MPANSAKASSQPARFFFSGLLLVGCLLVLQNQFRLVVVVGDSMEPTLGHGDLLVADKREYRERDPERGELVVAWRQGELIVKRVVGIPGEEVEVIEGSLFVNGLPVVEGYGPRGDRLSVRRGRLAADRFALVGDNRGIVEGQTVHAIVSKEEIVGRVVAIWRLRSPKGSEDPPIAMSQPWSHGHSDSGMGQTVIW
jgi:signal peptidase I